MSCFIELDCQSYNCQRDPNYNHNNTSIRNNLILGRQSSAGITSPGELSVSIIKHTSSMLVHHHYRQRYFELDQLLCKGFCRDLAVAVTVDEPSSSFLKWGFCKNSSQHVTKIISGIILRWKASAWIKLSEDFRLTPCIQTRCDTPGTCRKSTTIRSAEHGPSF